MKRRDLLIAIGGGIAGGSISGVIGDDGGAGAPLPGDGNETDTGNETDDGSTETEAVFDPVIESTNSPVDEGTTLTVDYSVSNIGGSLNNTTDVWLEIDTSEKDRDSDITVSSGGSTTGQLSYTPTTAGSHTVSVTTPSHSVSTSITVDSSLPDSAIHRWAVSEGSGSTVGDSIGSQDGTVNGATWASGTWQDNYALSFDGSDDNVNCGYVSDFDNAPFAIGITVEPSSLDADTRLIDYFNGGQTGAGWAIRLDPTDGNQIQWFHGTDGTGSTDALLTSTTLSTGTKYRFLVNFDPNNTVAIYLNSTQEDSISSTQYNPTSGGMDFLWAKNNQGGSLLNGLLDDVIFYDATLSSSEIQQDYDLQPWA